MARNTIKISRPAPTVGCRYVARIQIQVTPGTFAVRSEPIQSCCCPSSSALVERKKRVSNRIAPSNLGGLHGDVSALYVPLFAIVAFWLQSVASNLAFWSDTRDQHHGHPQGDREKRLLLLHVVQAIGTLRGSRSPSVRCSTGNVC